VLRNLLERMVYYLLTRFICLAKRQTQHGTNRHSRAERFDMPASVATHCTDEHLFLRTVNDDRLHLATIQLLRK
jgi:hypothetical protein